MQGGAWAVQGGGKVRDSCVGWAVWLGHAQGGLGCALGSPRIYLGQLASASRTKMRKVTSNPEVLGPSRSWSPAPAAPSIPRDLRTHLHRRGYLRRKYTRARLSWASRLDWYLGYELLRKREGGEERRGGSGRPRRLEAGAGRTFLP